MMEDIPLAFVLYYGMVCGPSYDRRHYAALICEWAIRVVAHGIAQTVGVACRIGEVVLAVVLVHP